MKTFRWVVGEFKLQELSLNASFEIDQTDQDSDPGNGEPKWKHGLLSLCGRLVRSVVVCADDLEQRV